MKEIILTQGKVALVDDGDYEFLNKFKWYAKKSRLTFYAVHNIRFFSGYGGQRQLTMHHMILGKSIDLLQCDHIDGNGLNNQRLNLRIVTSRQNCQNLHINRTSRYPGVSYRKGKCRTKPWIAHIWFGSHIQKVLGYFQTEEEAYAAYVKALQNNGEIPLAISEQQ